MFFIKDNKYKKDGKFFPLTDLEFNHLVLNKSEGKRFVVYYMNDSTDKLEPYIFQRANAVDDTTHVLLMNTSGHYLYTSRASGYDEVTDVDKKLNSLQPIKEDQKEGLQKFFTEDTTFTPEETEQIIKDHLPNKKAETLKSEEELQILKADDANLVRKISEYVPKEYMPKDFVGKNTTVHDLIVGVYFAKDREKVAAVRKILNELFELGEFGEFMETGTFKLFSDPDSAVDNLVKLVKLAASKMDREQTWPSTSAQNSKRAHP